MSDRPVEQEEQLRAILNGVAESIAEASDQELLNEKLEEGKEPSIRAQNVRALLHKAVSDFQEREQPQTEGESSLKVGDYSIEARLSKSTVSNGEYVEEKLDLSLAYKRREQIGSADRTYLSRFLERFRSIFASRLLPAFTFILVCIFGGILIYILRSGSEREIKTARQVEQKPPTQIKPQQTPAPEKRPENSPENSQSQKPNNPPSTPKITRQRGSGATATAVALQNIRTIFIDPQQNEFHQSLRAALIEQLQASGKLSVTEDRENSNARLKITESRPNQFTFELISGSSVIWTRSRTISERTEGTASKTASEMIEMLLRDAAASKK